MLPLDVLYAVTASISALVLALTAKFAGKHVSLVESEDHFLSVNEEDLCDGIPTDAARFHREIRLRRAATVACLLAIAFCEWRASLAPGPSLAFAAYLIPLSFYSVGHLSLLMLLAALVQCTVLLLPLQHNNPFAVASGLLYAICASISLTTPFGPALRDSRGHPVAENTYASIANTWLFMFATKVLALPVFEIEHLPILGANLRAGKNFVDVWTSLHAAATSRIQLLFHLLRINASGAISVLTTSFILSFAYYAPPYFLKNLLEYLDADPGRLDAAWAWFWVSGLFSAHFVLALLMGQMVFIGRVLNTRLQLQLNSLLFAKTLLRKDTTSDKDSSKANIIALMSSDVDKVASLADSLYDIASTPFEILVGVFFLYQLLGDSCLVGLAVTLVCLPLHQRSGVIVADAQSKLFKARDERVALTNEMLGAIRMLKFMAWETSFESRLLQIREKELGYQKLSFTIETLWTAMGNSVPIIFALVSFWHFTVVSKQPLTPAIAFTALSSPCFLLMLFASDAILVFTELQYSIKGIPEAIIRIVQGFVSAGRITDYLNGPEVAPAPKLSEQTRRIAFEAATIVWPVQHKPARTSDPDLPKFALQDVSLEFPVGELSLVCGRFASGKTLLLLALLGEADVLAGNVMCPRSPLNTLASVAKQVSDNWIVDGLCAYVPQTAWLRNQSIRDNILFNLPFDENRYRKTIRACALEADLKILDDGDLTEVGERGLNLSGGQKARVSFARAIYSRAPVLLLDDVLSAGESPYQILILVSHHVQLCAPGAAYVVALDKGRVQFQGDARDFAASGLFGSFVETQSNVESDLVDKPPVEDGADQPDVLERKPRKLVQEEERAIGNVDAEIWRTYFNAWGSQAQWIVLCVILLVAAFSPLLENGWLRKWAGSSEQTSRAAHSALFYVVGYAGLTFAGLAVKTLRWYILCKLSYSGSIKTSRVVFQRLLHSILFANIRFHDTISRGRLLNRFGKDMEGIDKRVATTIGHCIIALISACITFAVISVVGGPIFFAATVVLGWVHWKYGKMFSNASREMRRLSSVSSSPLHSLYWEVVSGITTVRAFGGSTQFLSDMLRLLDTNTIPGYWSLSMSQWLSFRSNALTSVLVGLVGVMAVLFARIDASLAGFTVMFATSMTHDFQNMAHRFAGLEQDMVALERIKEFSEIPPEEEEDAETMTPPPDWPALGNIRFEDFSVRYAPDLSPVLHDLNFEIYPGEKIGIIGRTGSGKSTLALSLFRFVPSSLTTGRILIDGIDIARVGLRDLRRSLTIIPQDPTILSGTIRSTLDPEGAFSDAEISSALRRVHLTHANLDNPVSEGGDNFSAGEKQLLCLGRAVLKHSRILVMDEATASVDYSTDALITASIREAFASSTVLTIAHRLSTIVAYDRVLVLHEGRVAEFDSPRRMLSDPASVFYAMCSATGQEEMRELQRLSGLS
ncbi:Multidrug resistance-associated ABC transporter protein [Mycena kentingensis (nom. inval.)]|nr:Multidrug resistance-associated ABC transporter protein [Mycena kentingensis (nom. inval.)]